MDFEREPLGVEFWKRKYHAEKRITKDYEARIRVLEHELSEIKAVNRFMDQKLFPLADEVRQTAMSYGPPARAILPPQATQFEHSSQSSHPSQGSETNVQRQATFVVNGSHPFNGHVSGGAPSATVWTPSVPHNGLSHSIPSSMTPSPPADRRSRSRLFQENEDESEDDGPIRGPPRLAVHITEDNQEMNGYGGGDYAHGNDGDQGVDLRNEEEEDVPVAATRVIPTKRTKAVAAKKSSSKKKQSAVAKKSNSQKNKKKSPSASKSKSRTSRSSKRSRSTAQSEEEDEPEEEQDDQQEVVEEDEEEMEIQGETRKRRPNSRYQSKSPPEVKKAKKATAATKKRSSKNRKSNEVEEVDDQEEEANEEPVESENVDSGDGDKDGNEDQEDGEDEESTNINNYVPCDLKFLVERGTKYMCSHKRCLPTKMVYRDRQCAKYHERIHLKDVKKLYQCPTCDMGYDDKSKFNKHSCKLAVVTATNGSTASNNGEDEDDVEDNGDEEEEEVAASNEGDDRGSSDEV